MACPTTPHSNHLLAALSPAVRVRLFPLLELTKLQLYARLHDSHRPVRHIYFPTNSVITLHYLLEDGSSTALATVGNEGMVGSNCLLADKSVNFPAQVQSAGFAYRLQRSLAKEEFDRHSEFLKLVLLYSQALMNQVSQTAVCNRNHSIMQRFSRWLLISLDRVCSKNLTMTQEFIGNMLGVRREGVSEAATNLQQLGVISYSRGRINVTDRQQLEALACDCYQIIKTDTDQLLNYVRPL
ncbi:MAG: Crp/Fnr family transcriptional regulator [Pseudohongiella sp.]|nr:Crp/Fnr family transcriptional regulator [Pseudohongiella sp.]